MAGPGWGRRLGAGGRARRAAAPGLVAAGRGGGSGAGPRTRPRPPARRGVSGRGCWPRSRLSLRPATVLLTAVAVQTIALETPSPDARSGCGPAWRRADPAPGSPRPRLLSGAAPWLSWPWLRVSPLAAGAVVALALALSWWRGAWWPPPAPSRANPCAREAGRGRGPDRGRAGGPLIASDRRTCRAGGGRVSPVRRPPRSINGSLPPRHPRPDSRPSPPCRSRQRRPPSVAYPRDAGAGRDRDARARYPHRDCDGELQTAIPTATATAVPATVAPPPSPSHRRPLPPSPARLPCPPPRHRRRRPAVEPPPVPSRR